jgi:hypothetical protein
MNKSNWMEVAKQKLESIKPRCACWQWCPGKLFGCSPTSMKATGGADSIRTPLDHSLKAEAIAKGPDCFEPDFANRSNTRRIQL